MGTSRGWWAAALACSAGSALGADLSATEQRWITAGWPVVLYARALQLPLDVVVQPQDAPGLAPLAMGYVDGRCKLVYSMRGNPEAEAMLAGTRPALQPLLIEAMTAHELGHCWRYVQGQWHSVPAGFSAPQSPTVDVQQQRALRDMQATRREEGFADLVALAWVQARYPERYAAVQTWMEAVRGTDDTLAGSHHDTLVWVARARDAAAIPPGATPFEQAQGLWRQGLLDGE